MNLSDPIADMLTRIRNANSANKATVSMPSSKKLVEIARVMKEEGYIADYAIEAATPRDQLVITLKYGERRAKTIRGIRRISKPWPADLCRQGRAAPCAWRTWHCHCVYFEGRHDRSRRS